MKPDHQWCLFTRTRPAAFATINESEEVGVALQILTLFTGRLQIASARNRLLVGAARFGVSP